MLLLAGSLVSACGSSRTVFTPNLAPNAAQYGWSWPSVSPPGAGISCQMPVTPQYQHRVGREDDGAFYRSISARAVVPFGTFGVISTEWEGGLVGDPLEAADDVADDIFSEQQLTQRRSVRLDIPGFYGREDTGYAPNGVFVAMRHFVGQNRIYVAVAIVAPQPGPLGTAEAFMGSIRLDASDALLPVGGPSAEPSALFMPETDFAVRMPPLTSRRSDDVEIAGETVTAQSFVAELPSARLRVRVIDMPERERGEGELVPALMSRLGLGEPGAPVSASGFPGTSFTRSTGGVSIQGRLFITASRIYVLEAASPAPSTDPLVRTFFDSFRIL